MRNSFLTTDGRTDGRTSARVELRFAAKKSCDAVSSPFRKNAPGPGVIVDHRKCEEYFYDQSKLHTAPAPDAKFQIPFQPVKSFSEY